MTTAAAIGYGVLFQIGNGASPEIFTTMSEVTSIKPPAMLRDAVDVTHMTSPEKWREFIMGLKDGGEVEMEMNFVASGPSHQLLINEFDTDVLGNKQVVFPTGEVWAFTAGCTGYEIDAPVDDKMTAAVTFKVSGRPTFEG